MRQMSLPRLATFSVNGSTRYGLVADKGIVDLSARHAGDYPTLREVIAAGALTRLAETVAHQPADFPLDAIAWQPPIPLRLELFRYDNRANPEDVNTDGEWGWRTQFNEVGLVADLGSGAELKAQALQGRTRMGFAMPTQRWIENRFRSAYVLVTRPFGPIGLTARLDVFDTRNRGSIVDHEYDDRGWAAMLAAKHDWKHFTALAEVLHVSSRRDQRLTVGLMPRQRQNQLQAELRIHW